MPFWKGESAPLPVWILYNWLDANFSDGSLPWAFVGALWQVCGMTLLDAGPPTSWGPAGERGSPEDPMLARETDIHVDGKWLGGISTAILMYNRHSPLKVSQRDRSWRLEGNGGWSRNRNDEENWETERVEVEPGLRETPCMGHSRS